MLEIKFIPHKNITASQINEIVNIKSISWPYSYNSQIDWISKNLKENDIHALMYNENSLVAYLNLIDIEIEIDGITISGFGIGNVCAKEKGKGWGTEIITQTNNILVQSKKIGILFCKNSLVNFYSKNKWKLIERENVSLSFENESIETFIYNYYKEIEFLKYLGKAF